MERPTLRVSAFEIPTSAPESDGTFAWDSTVLVTVEIERSGTTGFGYTYADASTAHFVADHLASIALAADPMSPPSTYAAMERAVRNLGREGVAATAISAVDAALWDLKAKVSRLPLVTLLGARRASVDAYGSGGFTSYSSSELARQMSEWKSAGFSRVKMKIGKNEDTAARVRVAREALGRDVELFVDANGAYDANEALAIADAIAHEDVSWFEEPVTSDDLDGLRYVRERAPKGMRIAAGEYGYRARYFDRMLSAGAVDTLQADATRCGITGFLVASSLCDPRGVPLSAHCAPSLHTHVACAAASVVHVEHFHDHDRIERMLLDGASIPKDGKLVPDLGAPGMGLTLKRADAERFKILDKRISHEGARQ